MREIGVPAPGRQWQKLRARRPKRPMPAPDTTAPLSALRHGTTEIKGVMGDLGKDLKFQVAAIRGAFR